MLKMPKLLVKRNSRSMTIPNRLAIGPKIEPALVATNNSN